MKKYTICWAVEYTNIQKIDAKNIKEAIDIAESNINFKKNPLTENFKLGYKHVYDFTDYDVGEKEERYDDYDVEVLE